MRESMHRSILRRTNYLAAPGNPGFYPTNTASAGPTATKGGVPRPAPSIPELKTASADLHSQLLSIYRQQETLRELNTRISSLYHSRVRDDAALLTDIGTVLGPKGLCDVRARIWISAGVVAAQQRAVRALSAGMEEETDGAAAAALARSEAALSDSGAAHLSGDQTLLRELRGLKEKQTRLCRAASSLSGHAAAAPLPAHTSAAAAAAGRAAAARAGAAAQRHMSCPAVHDALTSAGQAQQRLVSLTSSLRTQLSEAEVKQQELRQSLAEIKAEIAQARAERCTQADPRNSAAKLPPLAATGLQTI